jgi:hypothetical protein
MLFSLHQKWIIYLAVAICLSFLSRIVYADADGDSKVQTHRSKAYGVLQMDSQKQLESGLKTEAVQLADAQNEFETTGKIITIEPLLALRERYLLAKAEHKAARARLNQAMQGLKRQEELFKNGISSKRSLQELEAQKLSESASVDAADVRLAAIASEIRLNWGHKLSEWALAEAANNLKPFLQGQDYLLLVAYPANRNPPNELAIVQVSESGLRADARPATLIAKAQLADNSAQGESYFFRLRGEHYRTGMKLSVWTPVSAIANTGVIVPESALIWYMDQAYVFVKEGENKFVRRALSGFSAAPGGYFVREGLKPGEELVTSGAQMLLSEELRQQIPDEDQ